MLTYGGAHEYLGNLQKQVENNQQMSNEEKQRKIIDLKDADFWFNKGVNADLIGQSTISLDFYRQAIIKVPNHIPSLYNMAVVFDQLQQYRNSVQYFSQCSSENPLMEQAHIGECLSHIKTGDFENALRCIENAILSIQQ